MKLSQEENSESNKFVNISAKYEMRTYLFRRMGGRAKTEMDVFSSRELNTNRVLQDLKYILYIDSRNLLILS